jgi:hypothetical protein
MGQGADDICRRCKKSALIVSLGYVCRAADRPVIRIDISDLDLVDRLSGGRVDLTYGR